MPNNVGLFLRKNHYEIMLEDVIHRAPKEACGLIAGRDSISHKVFVITNILNSPVRFKMNPEEQLQAFNDIDSLGYDLLAIYHSHPKGPVGPSESDINEFAYPDTLYIVWSRLLETWICRCYKISGEVVEELPVHILESE